MSDEKKDDGRLAFVALALTPLFTIWWAFVITKVWAWFLTEPTGYTPSLALVVGVGLLKTMVGRRKADTDSVGMLIALQVLLPAMVLGEAALLRWWLL